MRQLFELCGRDEDVRFSPYVWRIRMALMHKGLDFEGVPIRFLNKQPLENAQSKTVPVLNDDGTWVKDSFEIALYLEKTYPDAPLFGGPIAEGQARLLNAFIDNTVVRGIFPMIVADIHARLDEKNGSYFREAREKFLGCSLEEAQAGRDAALPKFRASLTPIRNTLGFQKFLSGDAPAWADYCLFGTLMWARIASDFELLDADDPIHAWRESMLDLFDGYARSAKLAY
ncbi:glutathione S-transferase family protein [Kordiimonas lipolytica]|uniref:Glutathione S-transferase family protein n=1 Tax=Kordiimonas lipolytica TaxID=1662421 RepID=A0ABV8U4Z9_9PROT|nr:glutathione S-transferase family protein [Kordiimonas lipolytica]